MPCKSGATNEQMKSKTYQSKKNTLTFLGPAFYIDHTWTDMSGLMGDAGGSVATLMDYHISWKFG